MKNLKTVFALLCLTLLWSCGETCYECSASSSGMGIEVPSQTLCESDFANEEQFNAAVKTLEVAGMECKKK